MPCSRHVLVEELHLYENVKGSSNPQEVGVTGMGSLSQSVMTEVDGFLPNAAHIFC